MRMTARLAILISLSLALVAGCASTRDVVTAAPTVDELPDLTRAEGIIPADVGVEGAPDRPHVLLVAPMPEPEYTEEEKKILGIHEEYGYDPLELYRPPIGPEQGVTALPPTPLSGVGLGLGGGDIGLVPWWPPAGVGSDWAGAAPGISPNPVRPAGVGPGKARTAAAGPLLYPGVGNVGRLRRVACPYPPQSK
jgi:hypothetical protein